MLFAVALLKGRQGPKRGKFQHSHQECKDFPRLLDRRLNLLILRIFLDFWGIEGTCPTRDPYFEILGAPRGIMVTPSGGFDF